MESGHKSKNVPNKNLSKLGYLDLAFMADKGQKCQNLLFTLRRSQNLGSIHDYKSVPKIISIEIGFLDLGFATSKGLGTALRA